MDSIKLKFDFIILLTQPEELILSKLKHRKYCQNCDKSFCNFEYWSEDYQIPNIFNGVDSKCPHCESELLIRADDNLRAFKKRFFEFEVFSNDLKKYYSKNPAFFEFQLYKGVDDLSRLIAEISKRSLKKPKLLE